MRLVLTPSDSTGRLTVEFGSFLEFSLTMDIELEQLVERFDLNRSPSFPARASA
jgi:hypothetical protein